MEKVKAVCGWVESLAIGFCRRTQSEDDLLRVQQQQQQQQARGVADCGGGGGAPEDQWSSLAKDVAVLAQVCVCVCVCVCVFVCSRARVCVSHF